MREVATAVESKALEDPDLPEYDNLAGLHHSLVQGRIRALRSTDCTRLHTDYTYATWSPR